MRLIGQRDGRQQVKVRKISGRLIGQRDGRQQVKVIKISARLIGQRGELPDRSKEYISEFDRPERR